MYKIFDRETENLIFCFFEIKRCFIWLVMSNNAGNETNSELDARLLMERESTRSSSSSSVVKTSSTFRWFVLITFLFGSLSNAMAWLTFAPVPFETAAYYGISVNQVDIFSVIFMVVSIPVGILCIYLVDRIGLRYSLYCAMVFNTLGTVLRWVTLFHDGTDQANCDNVTDSDVNTWLCPAPEWSYDVALLATAVTALGQPFILVTPTKLAAQWFPSDQRLLANGIASLSNPLGIMMASLLAPIICHSPSDLVYLQGYFLIPTVLSLAMVFCVCQEGLYPSGNNGTLSEKINLRKLSTCHSKNAAALFFAMEKLPSHTCSLHFSSCTALPCFLPFLL